MSKNNLLERLPLLFLDKRSRYTYFSLITIVNLLVGSGTVLKDSKPARGDLEQHSVQMPPMEEISVTHTTPVPDYKEEIKKIFSHPAIPMDERISDFLLSFSAIASESLVTEQKAEVVDTVPAEWIPLIGNYIIPLEQLGISLQSLTQEGVFYFDIKKTEELETAENIHAVYEDFPQSITLLTKRINRQKSLIGISLMDVEHTDPALNAWLLSKIDVAKSFTTLPNGAYYKLKNGLIQPTPPEDISEIEAVLPLLEKYNQTELANFPLVAHDQPVQILYRGGVPLYVAVSESAVTKDVYWNPIDKQFYVFDQDEQPIDMQETTVALGSAYVLINFSSSEYQADPLIPKETDTTPTLPADFSCTKDGYLCTPEGKPMVSWSSKLPLELVGDEVFEVQGTEKKSLGLFAGLKKLGLIGAWENGKFSVLPETINPTQTTEFAQSNIEKIGNEVLASSFKDASSSLSKNEAVSALRKIIPGVENISDDFLIALLATEDKKFILNGEQGFYAADISSLARAVSSLGTAGGGSTLYQQTAKNVFMNFIEAFQPTWSRKYTNMQEAALLGNNLSEEQILRLYAEMLSKNGFSALTELWFAKSPAELNLAEGSLLAGYPQSPSLTSPTSFENVQRLLDRQEIVLSLVKANKLKSSQELTTARTEALLLLLPTPKETIPWVKMQLPEFTIDAAKKVTFSAGDNFLASLLNARLISPSQYKTLLLTYYGEFIWQQKLARKPNLDVAITPNYIVFNEGKQLTISNIPYDLFGASIEAIKDQAGEPVHTKRGILYRDSSNYTYYELSPTGQLLTSDLATIQNSETQAFVTIGDYLPYDAEILAQGNFDPNQLRSGSDGFAYWLSPKKEWFQVGQLVIHNNTQKMIVVPISSAELALVPANVRSESRATTAVSSALSLAAFDHSESPVVAESKMIEYLKNHIYQGFDPNEGAVNKDGQLLLYPKAIEKMMKSLGIAGTAVETQDQNFFIDSMERALNQNGAIVVLLGNEFQRKMPFYSVGADGKMQLEAVPNEYQYVVIKDIIASKDRDGNPQKWIVYVDPTRTSNGGTAAATIVATQEEFMEMAGQLGRFSYWTDRPVVQTAEKTYDYHSAEAQSRWFWETNGVGITSLDGKSVVDRDAFLREYSTIDVEFNNQVTDIIKEAVAKRHATGAVALIMDTQSGEIEVMTGVDKDGNIPPVNYATIPYVNGSTTKPLSIMAAGAAGVDLDKPVPAGDIYYFKGTKFFIKNWSYGGTPEDKIMTPQRTLTRSSNTGLINIGMETAAVTNDDLSYLEKFYATLQAKINDGKVAGLAEKTQILLEPNTGLGEYAMQWFGQRTQMDVIYLARWYAMFANWGQIPDLTVAKDTIPQRLATLPEIFDPTRIGKALQIVRDGLGAVTKPGGTAPYFGDALEAQGIKTFGKTGTAETGAATVSNATFACWIELLDGSKKVIIVTLFNGGEGSTHASPVANQIANEYVKALKNRPTKGQITKGMIIIPTPTPHAKEVLIPTVTPEPVTEVKLDTWKDVNRFYYGRKDSNTLLFGTSKETAQEVPLVNGIGYVVDANGNGAFLVPEESGFIHNILNLDNATIPPALQGKYSSVQDLRNAYGN